MQNLDNFSGGGDDGSYSMEAVNDSVGTGDFVYLTRTQALDVINVQKGTILNLSLQVTELKESLNEALNDECIWGDDYGVTGL